MSDLFESKNIKPMLIGETAEAFDNPNYLFEIKLDGERCIAYLDPKTGTELRNKRNMKMLSKVPELSDIHKQVKRRCILDGELIVSVDGKPDFYEIQRRSLTNNRFKILLQSQQYPASFIAYDILYDTDKSTAELPLIKRKKLLQGIVKENERLAVSRYIDGLGVALYNLTVEQNLEGVVAKLKDSTYDFDKRTSKWIKIKNMLDDDFVVCGYIYKENNVTSLVLGQYSAKKLIYKGHVTLGVSSIGKIIGKTEIVKKHPFNSIPPGNEDAIWLKPKVVCTVEYMMPTKNGGMRHPVFKGIRDDKLPKECIVND